MSQNLGPGEYLSIQLTVNEYIEAQSDLELQLMQNSQHLRLKQKHSSNEISQLQQQFTEEQTLIRNEMRGAERLSDEYYNLLAELEESQAQQEMQISDIENEANDYAQKIETENSMLETQIAAIKEDKENLKQTQKNNIQGK